MLAALNTGEMLQCNAQKGRLSASRPNGNAQGLCVCVFCDNNNNDGMATPNTAQVGVHIR